MFKHKRFVKIVSPLLVVAFVLSTSNLNVNAAHGTGNVVTGSDSRTKCLCL